MIPEFSAGTADIDAHNCWGCLHRSGLVGEISIEKRASVDWSGRLPVGRRKPRVILKWGLRNSVTRPNLGTIRGQ